MFEAKESSWRGPHRGQVLRLGLRGYCKAKVASAAVCEAEKRSMKVVGGLFTNYLQISIFSHVESIKTKRTHYDMKET
jgi:ribosomal protein S2